MTSAMRGPFLDRVGCPAGEGEGGSGEGGGTPDPSSLPAGEGGAGEGEGDVKNPRLKQLSDEAARHRMNAKAEKDRADAAEAKATELETRTTELEERLHDQLIRGAFLLATTGKVTDSEAAWKLADMSKVLVEDDGTVKGMDEAIAAVVKQYPYLQPEDSGSVDDTTKALRERFPALEPSGRPMNSRPQGDNPVNTAALERKFPALRNRR